MPRGGPTSRTTSRCPRSTWTCRSPTTPARPSTSTTTRARSGTWWRSSSATPPAASTWTGSGRRWRTLTAPAPAAGHRARRAGHGGLLRGALSPVPRGCEGGQDAGAGGREVPPDLERHPHLAPLAAHQLLRGEGRQLRVGTLHLAQLGQQDQHGAAGSRSPLPYDGREVPECLP